MFWAHHCRDFALKVLLLVVLACVGGMFAWLPISGAIIKLEVQQIVELEQLHFVTEGSFVHPAGFPGALKVPGIVLDSVAFRPGGFYLRIGHKLSPRRCWYDTVKKQGVRCR